jgi:tRNA threonylcarbamoyladenosine biosynthesis protein TsaE
MRFEALTQLQIESLADEIAALSRRGDLILLAGPLGAGKTTLARALIREFINDPTADVPSPSYTLAQSYRPIGQAEPIVWHFDFYRIEDSSEISELGLEEAQSEGLVLVEWPERAGATLAADGLLISLTLAAQPDERQVELEDLGGWSDRLKIIEKAME